MYLVVTLRPHEEPSPSTTFVRPLTRERDPYMMSISQDLQNLYSLDISSPNFTRHLHCLIRDDEKDQYLISLRGSELTQLLDFLDTVRAVILSSHRLTKQTLQALNAIPITDDVARECLHKLQTICSHHVALPSSYVISNGIARVGSAPVTLGGAADVWEGTYHGEKVSIKSLRVRTRNQRTLKKVRVRCGYVIAWTSERLWVLQALFKEAVAWKRLSHPNIVPFIGVTENPLQIISGWMSNGTLMEFTERDPGVNRIGLVSSPQQLCLVDNVTLPSYWTQPKASAIFTRITPHTET